MEDVKNKLKTPREGGLVPVTELPRLACKVCKSKLFHAFVQGEHQFICSPSTRPESIPNDHSTIVSASEASSATIYMTSICYVFLFGNQLGTISQFIPTEKKTLNMMTKSSFVLHTPKKFEEGEDKKQVLNDIDNYDLWEIDPNSLKGEFTKHLR